MSVTITKPKNTERGIFLNVGTGSSEDYERMGKGFTSFTPSTNPTIDTQHYIDESSPTHAVTATERQYSFEADRIIGDAVNDYVAGLDGLTGDAIETTMIDVDMQTLEARKYSVIVAVEQPYSIVGGEAQKMTGTIYTNGDVTMGTFDKSTKKFTPAS